LRRQRFTLRMIAAAERKGLVEVDLGAGRVTIRSAGGTSRSIADRVDEASGR
jgi:hypothetical protein